MVWSRQLVHHGLWDYDIDSAPVLLDVKKDGKTIPALVETTKQGFIFVLNRLTGEPVFPIKEKTVPQSDVPGELTSPTQPEDTMPPPTVPRPLAGRFPARGFASVG